MHSWIYEDNGQPYVGNVINLDGIYYSTTHGTMEGDSRVVVPIHENGTRTAPPPTSMNQYSQNFTRQQISTSRNGMNNTSGRRRTAPRRMNNRSRGGRMNTGRGGRMNMNRGGRMNLRPRPPVGSPCPPGQEADACGVCGGPGPTYECPDNTPFPGFMACEPNQCFTGNLSSTDVGGQGMGETGPEYGDMPSGCPSGYFRCWDGSCAPTLNQCPPNPNFDPGGGETAPAGQLQMPRVPGSNIGQCYCECAHINSPLDIDFFGFIGFCPSPGNHCDNQCTEYCNSQVVPDWYTSGGPDFQPGMPTMQFSFSQCYDLTP